MSWTQHFYHRDGVQGEVMDFLTFYQVPVISWNIPINLVLTLFYIQSYKDLAAWKPSEGFVVILYYMSLISTLAAFIPKKMKLCSNNVKQQQLCLCKLRV